MIHEADVSPQADPYVKVAGCTCLYRHVTSGRYYGVKKVEGKKKERSLGTTDRKIAERRLKEWTENLGKVDSEVEKTNLAQLHLKFVAVSRGKSDSSQCTIRGVIRDFENWWPHGLDFQVRNVRPSHLEEYLATIERRLRNTSFNRVAGVVKQIYELAVKDRMIAESPFKHVSTAWKKPQTPVRLIPTVAQFDAIVNSIRTQKCSRFKEETADFVEFLGLAGLGQAEASSLTWGDVDFVRGRMSVRRHKTDTRFSVPVYPHLRPLMERLKKNGGKKTHANSKVFKILDAKKALTNTCERLGFPHFSQRNLRQSLIMRLWKSGVDKKLIAKWQGHGDGGLLIMQTYTEVFGGDDADYELEQLAKLSTSASFARTEVPFPIGGQ